MSWTGAELQRFQDILLQAFPDRPALARMVKFQMGENLAAIADGSNLNDVVFALIGWAEARGKLDMLLRAAHTDNPDNAALQAFATQIGEAAVIRRLKEKAPVQYAVRLIPKRDFDVHGLLGKSERKYVLVGDYSEQRYKPLRQILAEFWAGDAFDRVLDISPLS